MDYQLGPQPSPPGLSSGKQATDAGDGRSRRGEISDQLTIHATIEEEVFYPTVRRTGDDAEDLQDADLDEDGGR